MCKRFVRCFSGSPGKVEMQINNFLDDHPQYRIACMTTAADGFCTVFVYFELI